ncbi:MAG TPA: cobalamin B12-binding domain-containing protein [Falsiroseomonas sp.]|jgi:methanogenic corrinoid protein MtbC1|nr:cobalamin B12-binding domain-containing protein [Falsiroseomonas sp.]
MASEIINGGVPLAEMSDSGQQCVTSRPGGYVAGHGVADLRDAPALLRAPRNRAAEHRRVAVLARALEAEVIPRLLLARHAITEPTHGAAAPAPSLADITTLAAIAMQGDFAGAAAFLAELRARNLPLERIYLEVLAPVARHLGDLWAADRCDFTSVTIGLCCLQQLVLENSPAFGPRPGRRGADRRVLLAPTPGEQHSFGLVVVGEFFRRQGWDVHSATGAPAREILAMLRKQWFSMVGFSLACDSRIEPLAALIREIRRNSRNPQIGVLVGGKAFLDRPELTALVGADATASDGQQAVLKAETLLALLVQEE